MPTPTPAIDTPWLTVPEGAAYARKSKNTITDALRSGALRGSQTCRNGKWTIHLADLDAWLRGERAAAQPERITRQRTEATRTGAA